MEINKFGLFIIALVLYYVLTGNNSVTCPKGQKLVNGKCVCVKCPIGMGMVDGECVVYPPCDDGMERLKGKCVIKPCPDKYVRDGPSCTWSEASFLDV